MDYTKRFLSFLIDEIIFSVMSIVLMLILSHIGILKENFNFSIIGPIIFWSLFIFKDLKGKSFGKSIFNLISATLLSSHDTTVFLRFS